MPETNIPAIPVWLADQPTLGGLVVPWVTPRTANARYLTGTIDADRAHQAIQHRWCGVCARPLHDTLVLLRLSDLPGRCTNEPALHPQCAAYTIKACPMVAGRLDHYRSTPRALDQR